MQATIYGQNTSRLLQLDDEAVLAGAAHAVDGALAFDDNGAFGSEALAEFGDELVAAFEQGAEGGGEMTNEECRMMNCLLRRSAFVIRIFLRASEVAGDEEFELGVGEEAVLRARVLEAVDG